MRSPARRLSTRCVPTLCLLAVFASVSVAQPESLLTGDSLDGWTVKPSEAEGHWRLNDGVLTGENPDKVGSNLWTEKEYGDFELEVEYRTPSDYYDTGVFARGEGHQVQIGISGSLKRDMTASIYAPVEGQGGYPAKAPGVEELQRPGEWNRLRMVVRGDRIETFLNGEPMVDYRAAKLPARGPIGLQLHAGHHMKLLFRDLKVTEIGE
ncbi:DUF1080 domain-containing protein [Botrimarina sp.]|uniref:3-keto-disaccharide hydrolase n=1 Tax=Botrimarina sp. TaxID=2795802 RepID=UPI0032F050A9